MTRLNYSEDNLNHTIEGSKDDIILKLVDILNDNDSITIDTVNTVHIPSTPKAVKQPSLTASGKKRKKPVYKLTKSQYAEHKNQVFNMIKTGSYNLEDIYRMFPKVAKSTIRNWTREAGHTERPKLKSKTSTPIVQETKIASRREVSNTNRNHNAENVFKNLF